MQDTGLPDHTGPLHRAKTGAEMTKNVSTWFANWTLVLNSPPPRDPNDDDDEEAEEDEEGED
jgi:hypothetical protein